MLAQALDVPISSLLETAVSNRKSRTRVSDENEIVELVRPLSSDQLKIAKAQIEALRSLKRSGFRKHRRQKTCARQIPEAALIAWALMFLSSM
jgi:hypothetical protein